MPSFVHINVAAFAQLAEILYADGVFYEVKIRCFGDFLSPSLAKGGLTPQYSSECAKHWGSCCYIGSPAHLPKANPALDR